MGSFYAQYAYIMAINRRSVELHYTHYMRRKNGTFTASIFYVARVGFTILAVVAFLPVKWKEKLGPPLAFLLIYLLRLYWGIELQPVFLKGAVAGGFIGGIIVLGVKGSRSASKYE